MKRMIFSATALAVIGASLALGGCADDGYHRGGYSSASFGYTSDDGYHRGHRDRDHDGVPNRDDPAPNNPYIR